MVSLFLIILKELLQVVQIDNNQLKMETLLNQGRVNIQDNQNVTKTKNKLEKLQKEGKV